MMGACLIGRVPHVHWKTTTFVATLRHDAPPRHSSSNRPVSLCGTFGLLLVNLRNADANSHAAAGGY